MAEHTASRISRKAFQWTEKYPRKKQDQIEETERPTKSQEKPLQPRSKSLLKTKSQKKDFHSGKYLSHKEAWASKSALESILRILRFKICPY